MIISMVMTIIFIIVIIIVIFAVVKKSNFFDKESRNLGFVSITLSPFFVRTYLDVWFAAAV